MNTIMFIVVCVAAVIIAGTYIYTFLKDKQNITAFMSMITELMPKIIDLFNDFVIYNDSFNAENDISVKKEIATNYIVENIITVVNELEISDEIKRIANVDNIKPLIKPIINKLVDDLNEKDALAAQVSCLTESK